MSEAQLNPYEAPQTQSPAEASSRYVSRTSTPNYRLRWLFAFCANLPLCGIVGMKACDGAGRIGMILTVIAFYYATQKAYRRDHADHGYYIAGAFVVALSQAVPILHLFIGGCALVIVTLGAGGVYDRPLGFFEASFSTAIVACGLLLVANALGKLFAVLFSDRHPSLYGGSDYETAAKEREIPPDFHSTI